MGHSTGICGKHGADLIDGLCQYCSEENLEMLPSGVEKFLTFIKLGEDEDKIYFKGFFTKFEPHAEFYLNIVKKTMGIELLPKW